MDSPEIPTKEEISFDQAGARFLAEVAYSRSAKSIEGLVEAVQQELSGNSTQLSMEARDRFQKMDRDTLGRMIEDTSKYGIQAESRAVFENFLDKDSGYILNSKGHGLWGERGSIFGVLFAGAMAENIRLKRGEDESWRLTLSRGGDPKSFDELRGRYQDNPGLLARLFPVEAEIAKPIDVNKFNGAVDFCLGRLNEIFEEK